MPNEILVQNKLAQKILFLRRSGRNGGSRSDFKRHRSTNAATSNGSVVADTHSAIHPADEHGCLSVAGAGVRAVLPGGGGALEESAKARFSQRQCCRTKLSIQKTKVIPMSGRNCDTMERRNVPKSNKQRGSSPRRFLISPKLVETIFTLDCPKAGEVYLCGDFNEWSPVGLRMIQRTENGHWEKRLALAPGRYEYKFVVDGEWIHDLHACENVPNAYGSLNSVVEVRL
jgi:hypothetical protein